jgi:predicted  nucleic acid-binding Zn ribbon protein
MDVRTTARNPAPPKSDFFHCDVCFHIWIVPRSSFVEHVLRPCPACAAARGVLAEERFGVLKFRCLNCKQVWDVPTPIAPHRPDAA